MSVDAKNGGDRGAELKVRDEFLIPDPRKKETKEEGEAKKTDDNSQGNGQQNGGKNKKNKRKGRRHIPVSLTPIRH